MYNNYINQHAKQDADRLGGSYGIKEGVEILPQSRTIEAQVVTALPAASKDSYGADSRL
jgi:hypothetical protein